MNLNLACILNHNSSIDFSEKDYSPGGMVMPERSFAFDFYRFGAASGQEKDDEIYGSGNSYTAEYWQYDSRLVRRWNVDPVVKHSLSRYATFSNNPIIFIDPNGDTDYYSFRGKKIGSDGNDNGLQLLILSKSTEREIKREVRTTGLSSLNQSQLKTSTPVPNNETISKLDETLSLTKLTGNTEYGFVVGIKDGQQLSSDVYAGTAGSSSEVPSFRAAAGAIEVSRAGGIPGYSVHSHPNVLRYNLSENNYSTSEYGPSEDNDLPSAQSSIYANVVLELRSSNPETLRSTDMQNAKSNPGTWLPRSDTVSEKITFYNDKVQLKTMDYKRFKSLTEKIKTPK